MNLCESCGSHAATQYYQTFYCAHCSPSDYAFQCVSCANLFDAQDLGWSGFHSSLCTGCATPALIEQEIRKHARRLDTETRKELAGKAVER
jgi:hypothetical protein